MAETLRDMVVSLSLNSDNFSANLRSKLAASGVTNFENTAAGAQAQLASLQQKFQLQQQAVQQYERALEAAKGKLETSVQTHEKLAAKLDTARQRHADLGQQVDKLTADLREAEEAGLKGTDAYAEMEAELERLKSEYAASGQEVQKLEGQLSRSENAMRRNADAVTKANTNLNNARAGLQQIQSHIAQVTSRLQRLQNSWLNAADRMAQFGEKAKAAGKSVEGVGKSLSKLSAVAIGAGTVAVKTFASYDDAIRQVYATMGLSESESTAEMKALSDAAQEMGASTRYSASEAASALNYLALAGYDSEKAIEALPTVLNLAQASGIDLASASDIVCTGTGDVLYACLCGSDGEGQPEIQHLRGPAWRRHAQGLGVEQDYAQAAKLFASVAASENKSATGVVDAGYELARLYEQGLGVEQDLDRAIDLYEEAEEKDSEDAVAALERLGK